MLASFSSQQVNIQRGLVGWVDDLIFTSSSNYPVFQSSIFNRAVIIVMTVLQASSQGNQDFAKGTSSFTWTSQTKGSDQNCRKRLTSERVAASNCENLIYIPGSCYLHMFNACVKSALTLVDDMLASCFSKETLGGFNRYL